MQIKPFYRNIPLLTTYFDELAILLGLFMISDGCHLVVSWLFFHSSVGKFLQVLITPDEGRVRTHQCTSTSVWKVYRREKSLQIV